MINKSIHIGQIEKEMGRSLSFFLHIATALIADFFKPLYSLKMAKIEFATTSVAEWPPTIAVQDDGCDSMLKYIDMKSPAHKYGEKHNTAQELPKCILSNGIMFIGCKRLRGHILILNGKQLELRCNITRRIRIFKCRSSMR